MFEHYTQTGIIDAGSLKKLLSADPHSHKAIKIIDSTFVLPTSDKNPEKDFTAQHIPGACFYDIKANANPDSTIPNTLPTPPDFARSINRLGISNDDFIVVYGQDGMVMGPARLWWMFRVFGHDKVCVLDGGLPTWINAGFETTDEPAPTPEHATQFTTTFQEHLFQNIQNIKKHCESKDDRTRILDARSPERFSGQTPEPRAGMRCGHIPCSINIPAKSLVDSQTGCLKPKDELRHIFKNYDLLECPYLVASCGSGITACMIALALFNIGRNDVAIYDGSWSEWGHENAGTPISCL